MLPIFQHHERFQQLPAAPVYLIASAAGSCRTSLWWREDEVVGVHNPQRNPLSASKLSKRLRNAKQWYQSPLSIDRPHGLNPAQRS